MPVPQSTASSPERADAKVIKPTVDWYHPCDPLTPDEIRLASGAFRTALLQKGIRSVKSTYVDLIERKPTSLPRHHAFAMLRADP